MNWAMPRQYCVVGETTTEPSDSEARGACHAEMNMQVFMEQFIFSALFTYRKFVMIVGPSDDRVFYHRRTGGESGTARCCGGGVHYTTHTDIKGGAQYASMSGGVGVHARDAVAVAARHSVIDCLSPSSHAQPLQRWHQASYRAWKDLSLA